MIVEEHDWPDFEHVVLSGDGRLNYTVNPEQLPLPLGETPFLSHRSEAPTMLYNLNHILLDHRGEPIHEDKQPVTLGAALERAAIQGGAARTGEDKFKQFKLAQKLAKGGLIELTAEEVARLKELTGAMFTPIAVGAVWTALENPVKPLPDFSPGMTA